MNMTPRTLPAEAVPPADVAGAHPVRVHLVEPNPLVVSALGVCFAGDPRFELSASCESGAALLEAPRGSFDVAVVAWQTTDIGAAEILRAWRAAGRTEPVTVFSNTRDLGTVRQAVRLGAQGYCYQFDDPSVLFDTLHAVANGRICVPFIDVTAINDTPLASLTVRERELLDVLARGWTNQQIANRTGISENTVKYHLKNLYEKLGVRNRAMAVAIYSREVEG
ncbi:nitrate/nitrite regulatory protein [Roseivivax marinus]|uniref:Nitrate/nitrite regulatory protein n=2 Tax=Roseivivax marinus TaxID=1379903 RepID=W4HFN7_9RHOB|nr:response regulator transcription factor [Roseivivax marinus]ETW10946.1 nitrate/nitrite regulatory protein [Roseivivax marinus]UMA64944.1 response regulator transcription factor [Roseivivax marinus]SEL90829.1 two component transcriptional regulator, LuxR family [Roseivivax marinus]